MHVSSYSKMESFFKTYGDKFPSSDGKSKILDIGSKSYEGQRSYRDLVDDKRHTYIGLDLELGLNVDIVTSGAYVWPELEDDSFDVCISGQTFEHNPFFWVTACEIARVLKPGGFAAIIAPGAGSVHRFPFDCWRFYPDSWAAICALAGLDLAESFFEPNSMALNIPGGQWRDSMLIARKPAEEARLAEAAERRDQIVKPFREGFGHFEPAPNRQGPCVADYKTKVQPGMIRTLRYKVGRLISGCEGHAMIYEPKS